MCSLTFLIKCILYLFSVELVELCFITVFSPQTQHFGLGTVCHVDEFFIPPPITDGASHTAQDDAVITHFHKQHVARVVWPPVNRERLLLHHTTAQWLQINVITMLEEGNGTVLDK